MQLVIEEVERKREKEGERERKRDTERIEWDTMLGEPGLVYRNWDLESTLVGALYA